MHIASRYQKNSRKQSDDPPVTQEGSAIQQIRRCITDGHLKLADGSSSWAMIGACHKEPYSNKPQRDSQWRLHQRRRRRLMFSKTESSAAVRSSLVSDTQLTAWRFAFVCADRWNCVTFAIARVDVDTPYYKGEPSCCLLLWLGWFYWFTPFCCMSGSVT